MIRNNSYSTIGTSFHGYVILTSAKNLVKVLNIDPYDTGDEKTTYEWQLTLETENGDINFTIYDYKDVVEYDENVWYHIGAENSKNAEIVAKYLENEYKFVVKDTYKMFRNNA